MKKYDPLKQHLSRQTANETRMTFSEIEKIIGADLPTSARTHEAWWGSDPKHSQGKSWLDAGYRASPKLHNDSVVFIRIH